MGAPLTIRSLGFAAVLSLLAGPVLAQGSLPAPRPAQARAPAEMLTEANLSRDALRAVFEAAKLPTSLDQGGNLKVTVAPVTFYALAGKDHVRLLATYGFNARAAYQEKLDLANRINDGFIVVRATVPAEKPREIAIDHYILLGPGVSRAGVVAAARRFGEIIREALAAVDSDGLLK